MEIERGSTRSPSVENWLWKGLWTGRKTDKRMNECVNGRMNLLISDCRI